MEVINNTILRIIFALILGVILIFWPSTAINYLVITIGILFLIPGLISIIGYLSRSKQSPETMLVIESIGSCFLGLVLIIAPAFFVGALMYIIAIVLILAGFFQLRGLFTYRRNIKIPTVFYIVPAIVLIIGLVIIFNPFRVIETTFMILGIACVVYSISELINYLKFTRKLR
jgi:Uncharacterized conserved protein